MPALTHGRVKNGFNLFPTRSVETKKVERKDCPGCFKECTITKLGCGKPASQSLEKRVNHYSSSSTKRANALGTVGRSAAARRAIMRRTSTNNCKGNNCKSKKDNTTINPTCCKEKDCECK